MKFKYYGKKPEVDSGGFTFRIDSVENCHDRVNLVMDFMPEIPTGYELITVPEYTPTGWVFKQLEDNSNGLSAVYEPVQERIDPRDEVPQGVQLRIYVIKTIKQEYVEDE